MGEGVGQERNGIGAYGYAIGEHNHIGHGLLSRVNKTIFGYRRVTIIVNQVEFLTVSVRHLDTMTATNLNPAEYRWLPLVTTDVNSLVLRSFVAISWGDAITLVSKKVLSALGRVFSPLQNKAAIFLGNRSKGLL